MSEPANENTPTWAVLEIGPDAVSVRVSREAARRSGQKLNSWVSAAIARASEPPKNEGSGG